MVIPLIFTTLTHNFYIAPSEPIESPCRGASCVPSGLASCIHWQYAILFRCIHHTICTVVSQMSYLCCTWPNLLSKLVIEQRGSSPLFPSLENRSWAIFPTPFQPHLKFAEQTLHILLFPSLLGVLKILFFNKHLLLQNHAQHQLSPIPQVAMQGFALLLKTLLNPNQPSHPFLSRKI